MDPLTLVTAALTLATPYLIKSGEKIAEGIGEEIWNLIKKPFTKKEVVILDSDLQNDIEKEQLMTALLEKINLDNNFKQELENAVTKAQKVLKANYQQNINNNGQIDKQINVQNLTGDINF